jgi:hypothetical protein
MHRMRRGQHPQPESPVRRELKRHLLTLVGAVVVLDGLAIGVYYFFQIADRQLKTQQMFVAVWVVVTLVVVTTMMKRIRLARRRRV